MLRQQKGLAVFLCTFTTTQQVYLKGQKDESGKGRSLKSALTGTHRRRLGGMAKQAGQTLSASKYYTVNPDDQLLFQKVQYFCNVVELSF